MTTQLDFQPSLHRAWQFERVIELIFDGGMLQQEFDRSEQMAEVRQYLLKGRDDEKSALRRDRREEAGTVRRRTMSEARELIESAFDHRYRS